MRSHLRMVSSAAAFALTCVVSTLTYFYWRRSQEINEVMVFCKLQFNAYNCFDTLMSYIEGAKRSITVCMPGIENPAIQGRLVDLMKKKKIVVRIIIDETGYNESSEVFMNELIHAGAEVRCKFNQSPYRMQHKFCLIDDKLLMSGTLNWGCDLSSDHWNYVYITNKHTLVEPVTKGFYQLWNEYSRDIISLETPTKRSTTVVSDNQSLDTSAKRSTTVVSDNQSLDTSAKRSTTVVSDNQSVDQTNTLDEGTTVDDLQISEGQTTTVETGVTVKIQFE